MIKEICKEKNIKFKRDYKRGLWIFSYKEKYFEFSFGYSMDQDPLKCLPHFEEMLKIELRNQKIESIIGKNV